MIVVVVCFSHDITSKSFKCKRRLLFSCSIKEEKCRAFFFSPLKRKKSDLNPKPLFCLGY